MSDFEEGRTVGFSYGELCLLDLLQTAFIVLKLLGKIDWSWAKVLIPVWIELGVFVVLTVVFIAITIYKYKNE